MMNVRPQLVCAFMSGSYSYSCAFQLSLHRSPVRAPTPPSRMRTWEVGRFRLVHMNSPAVSRTTGTHLIKTLSCEVLTPQFQVTFIFPLWVLFVFFTETFLTAPLNWSIHAWMCCMLYLLSFSFNIFYFSQPILLHFAFHGYPSNM